MPSLAVNRHAEASSAQRFGDFAIGTKALGGPGGIASAAGAVAPIQPMLRSGPQSARLEFRTRPRALTMLE
jgi:hypothetical protein